MTERDFVPFALHDKDPDQQLADALVEAGILNRANFVHYFWVPGSMEGDEPYTAEQAISDGRTAMACMEAWREIGGWFNISGDLDGTHHVRCYTYAGSVSEAVATGTNLPRAICEAFVEARK